MKSFTVKLKPPKIFKNPDVFTEDYIPSEFLFRDEEIEQIKNSLAFPLRYGSGGDHILINGPPGTGKSHIAKKLTQLLNEYAEKNHKKVRYIYISGKNKTVPDFFSTLADTPINSGTHNAILEIIKMVNNYKTVCFVIDEFDRLKSSLYHTEPLEETLGTFTRLHEYSTELTAHIFTAIITNKINIRRYLTPSTASAYWPTNIFFPEYNASQLNKILISRVKIGYRKEIMDNGFRGVMAQFSAQLYQSSSNLRQGIRILKKLGEILEETGKTKITINDIEKARKIVEAAQFQTKIMELDDNQIVFLVSLADLQNKNKNTSTTDILKEYNKNCNRFNIHTSLKPRYLLERVVPNLESMGFFLSTVKGLGRRKGTERTFDINSEDLKEILEIGAKELIKRAEGRK